MLKNISGLVMTLKYNGRAVQVAPGQTIDLTGALDLTPSSASLQEARFITKFAGSIIRFGEDPAKAIAEPTPEPIAEKQGAGLEEPENTNAPAEVLFELSKKELVEVAKKLGVKDANTKRSKETLIDMIVEAKKKSGG